MTAVLGPQLFRQLVLHQIFGANTDVGKTILTTALVRAAAQRGQRVHYLKPVSTGPSSEADDAHIDRYTKKWKSTVFSDCIHRFKEPVSPHLVVSRKEAPTQKQFMNSVSDRISRTASTVRGPEHMFVETAGGVHSPTLTGISQADAYRPLLLPTVLVGDAKLGGISSTIAAHESLLLRGFTIDAVMIFEETYYRNAEYLKAYFAEHDIKLFTFPHPPTRSVDSGKDITDTENYYESLISNHDVIEHLRIQHEKRMDDLESLAPRAMKSIWWPFVQHGLVRSNNDVAVVDSAHGDCFSVFSTGDTTSGSSLHPQFDASASWWTQAVGHSHPNLAKAAARAAGRYGHVLFPQTAHAPAVELAEKLLEGPGRGWAHRVYLSDDGSTGMEVALKMALRAYAKRHPERTRGNEKKMAVLGLKGSYHGDTIGAMDACEEGVYSCEWHNARGYWLEAPTVAIRDGKTVVDVPECFEVLFTSQEFPSILDVYDVEARINTDLARLYRSYLTHLLTDLERQQKIMLSALVLEPLVLGAGGMIFVDPLFQRVLVDVAREVFDKALRNKDDQWSGMPVIFDEVFTGLHRLGFETCGAPVLGVTPDIQVHAKILTGGLIPLAATLASDSIFSAFLGETKPEALLHGHSYAGHPVGCEVANESLKLIETLLESDDWQNSRQKWIHVAATNQTTTNQPAWSFWNPDAVSQLSHAPDVESVMTLGTLLAVKFKDDQQGYQSFTAQEKLASLKTTSEKDEFAINFRTLGNVAYFMSSLNTPPDVIQAVEDRLLSRLLSR